MAVVASTPIDETCPGHHRAGRVRGHLGLLPDVDLADIGHGDVGGDLVRRAGTDDDDLRGGRGGPGGDRLTRHETDRRHRARDGAGQIGAVQCRLRVVQVGLGRVDRCLVERQLLRRRLLRLRPGSRRSRPTAACAGRCRRCGRRGRDRAGGRCVREGRLEGGLERRLGLVDRLDVGGHRGLVRGGLGQRFGTAWSGRPTPAPVIRRRSDAPSVVDPVVGGRGGRSGRSGRGGRCRAEAQRVGRGQAGPGQGRVGVLLALGRPPARPGAS